MSEHPTDESKLQYFDKVTGQSNHISHIANPNQMNAADGTIHDDSDETVGLLIAEPTPVRYNSIPSLIRNNENIIVDEQPTAFYNRWRLRLYIIAGVILAILLFVILSLLNIKTVLNSIDIKINNIEVLETNSTGASISLQDINVNFGEAGILSWIERLNQTDIEFVNNTVIYNEHHQPLLEIDTQHKHLTFTVRKNSSYYWAFDLNELFVNIEGERVSKTIYHLSTHKTSVFYIAGKIKFAGKTFSLGKMVKVEKNELEGLLDRVLSELIAGISVQNVQIDKYSPTIGYAGRGDAVLKIDSIQKMQLPKIGTSLGFKIHSTFYEVVNVTFENFANIEDEHFVLFNFILFNVNETIINSGKVNDVIWRLLNDDSKESKFEFVIRGNQVDDDGWIRDMWENIILDVGIRFHDILDSVNGIWNPDLGQAWDNADVTDLTLGLNDTSGQLMFNTHLLYLYGMFMENFEANIQANVLIKGINMNFRNTTVRKIDDLFVDANVSNTTLSIVDVKRSQSFLQGLLDKDFENIYVPIKVNARIEVNSDFFKGPIDVNGSLSLGSENFDPSFSWGVHEMADGVIEMVDIKYIDGKGEHVKFEINSKVRTPPFMNNFENDIEVINTVVNYDFEEVFFITMFPFEGIDGLIPMKLEVTLDSSNDEKKRRVEEFVGEIISGDVANITVNGISAANASSIYGCNTHICELYDHLSIPLSLSSKDITGDGNGQNYFIRDTIMHIMSKEVEMTLFNPISNRNLILEIEEGEAICEGYVIGFLKEKVTWEVESGIWKSPKVKVEYANTGSAGWKIIEKAIKGDGRINNMTVRAVVKVRLSGNTEWSGLNIMYRSTGHTNGKVRW